MLVDEDLGVDTKVSRTKQCEYSHRFTKRNVILPYLSQGLVPGKMRL